MKYYLLFEFLPDNWNGDHTHPDVVIYKIETSFADAVSVCNILSGETDSCKTPAELDSLCDTYNLPHLNHSKNYDFSGIAILADDGTGNVEHYEYVPGGDSYGSDTGVYNQVTLGCNDASYFE